MTLIQTIPPTMRFMKMLANCRMEEALEEALEALTKSFLVIKLFWMGMTRAAQVL